MARSGTGPLQAPSGRVSEPAPPLGGAWPGGLASYVPRLALDWVTRTPAEEHRSVQGTLVFVDVSGFTALTERLAAHGRAGAEEINEIVGSTFTELANIAARYGADLLKWGGDAAVLFFDGPGSAARGARASWLMANAMHRLGRLRTSVGRVELKVSIGVHSGIIELFLLPGRHRELVIAGPGATLTVEMEAAARAGEVVVSAANAASLDAGVLGEPRGKGVLLTGEPRADESPAPAPEAPQTEDPALLIPERLRGYLQSDNEDPEHRPIVICFVEVMGLDHFIDRRGAPAAARELGTVIRRSQEAADRHEATFYGTDIAPDGVKIMVLGGVPTFEGNDTDRVLRSALEIVHPPLSDALHHAKTRRDLGELERSGTPDLALRAGVNAGQTFVFPELRLGRRRIFSITGDAVNLAARVVRAASPGQVLCTDATRAGLRAPFILQPLPAFSAKGKAEPVITYAVGEEAGGAPRAARAQPTFVGRNDELKLLLAAAADVRGNSNGKVVEVIGTAGIGKSRLVDEAASGWRLTTWRVQCDAFGGGQPYRPLRPMARALLGLEDDVPRADVASALSTTLEERAPALLPWASLLADVFDVFLPVRREVEELEPRFRRPRLEAAFVELAGRLAPGPTGFIFEDTHGLDEASASLLLRVAEETEVRPWLVVTTHQPGGLGGFDRELSGRLKVDLGPLDGASCEQLVSELGDDIQDPRQRRVLVERAEGNPLFLMELARALRVTGSPEALPDSLEPLLAARVDRLSPADRQSLRTAAVLGQRFDDELLARVVEDAELIDAALWVRLSEFVREEGGERVFTHALLRDAAYEGLSFRRRRELHARAATAIEQRASGGDTAVELLSVHWLAAERWERAWECARTAGEKLAVLRSNVDAATHFRRALAAAQHVREVPAADVARVGEMLGDVCELAGDYERARSAYTRAYQRVNHAVVRARLLRKVGVLHERRGSYPQALRCYTGALRRLDGEDPAGQVERCELELARAGVRHRQWRLHDSTAAAAVAGEVATVAGYRSGLAHSLYLRHINSVYLNEPDDGLAHSALEIFAELGDLVGQGNVLNNLGISAYYRGAWDQALEHYGASRDARERTGDLVGAATEENNIGEVLSDQGHYAEAGTRFSAARSSWRTARYRVGEALATSNLGRLAARRGHTLEGAEMLEQARAAFVEIHAVSFIDETDLRLLECTLLAGELKRAAEVGSELAARFAGRPGYARLHATALRFQGTALTRLGDYQAALPLLDESVGRLRAIAESFELAQSLQARAVLRRALEGISGAGAWPLAGAGGAGVAGVGADEAEAEATLERLGVSRLLTA
jgi:class 3 adenylate cyclase/tetratricopeptide (TPR) repeat protein